MGKEPLYPHKTPLELKEKRTTTVHDRYQIGCSGCGFLFSEMNLAAALKEAKRVQPKHAPDTIAVFDVMAKYGTCNTWDPSGKCLHRKSY
jgi:hypothetical protein